MTITRLFCRRVIDRVLIADGSAGLNKGRNPRAMCDLYTVTEGKERVACQDCAFQVKVELGRFCNGLSDGIDTTGLTASFADQLPVLNQRDGV